MARRSWVEMGKEFQRTREGKDVVHREAMLGAFIPTGFCIELPIYIYLEWKSSTLCESFGQKIYFNSYKLKVEIPSY